MRRITILPAKGELFPLYGARWLGTDVVNDAVGLRLSARGRLILDSVLAQLVP